MRSMRGGKKELGYNRKISARNRKTGRGRE